MLSSSNKCHFAQVMTGRYVGELDGTTKLEWVKAQQRFCRVVPSGVVGTYTNEFVDVLVVAEARGKQKDKEHALTIEKMTNRDGYRLRLGPQSTFIRLSMQWFPLFTTKNR